MICLSDAKKVIRIPKRDPKNYETITKIAGRKDDLMFL